MLSFAQSLVEHALGSGRCNEKKMARHARRKDYFAALPDDLLSSIIGLLDVKSLLSLQQCDKRLRKLAVSGCYFTCHLCVLGQGLPRQLDQPSCSRKIQALCRCVLSKNVCTGPFLRALTADPSLSVSFLDGISLQGSEKVWLAIFMGRFGIPSKNQETAHKLAGAWQVGICRQQCTCYTAPLQVPNGPTYRPLYLPSPPASLPVLCAVIAACFM